MSPVMYGLHLEKLRIVKTQTRVLSCYYSKHGMALNQLLVYLSQPSFRHPREDDSQVSDNSNVWSELFQCLNEKLQPREPVCMMDSKYLVKSRSLLLGIYMEVGSIEPWECIRVRWQSLGLSQR